MSKRILLAIHGLLFIGLSTLAFFTEGTGGGGDSITHFFFAEISWREPVNLLDLWAKPFYTLIASPFAQFGFTGIKIFTILCGVAASYFSCLTAKALGKPWYWAILVLAFVAPAFYTYLFSGLTEPFAALLCIVAVWLCFTGRVSAGFILASFLPFTRTEAQVFLILFAAFGILEGHYKKLPLLLTGYVIYGVVGWIVFDNPLWIFDHPYNAGGSAYGSGNWYHYLDRLRVMLAWPGISLAALGFIQLFIRLFSGQVKWKKELLLVHGLFLSLLAGHSLVWALGIYGSAGLERTLFTVFPFLWIIMLDGLILLKNLSARLFKGHSYILPVVFILIQTYVSLNHPVSRYYYEVHLNETPNNRFFRDRVATFIQENYPDAEHYVISDPYMAVPLGLNYKDPNRVATWSSFRHPEVLPDKTVFIYDSYYVPVHDGINLEEARTKDFVEVIKTWETEGGHIYALLIKKAYYQ